MLYNLQVSKSFASTLLLNTQFSSHLHSICLSAQAKLKNDMKNSPHFLHFTFKYSSSPTALSNVTYKKKFFYPFFHSLQLTRKWRGKNEFLIFFEENFSIFLHRKRGKERERKNEKLFLAHLHPFSAPCDTLKYNLFCNKNVAASPYAGGKKVVIASASWEGIFQ